MVTLSRLEIYGYWTVSPMTQYTRAELENEDQSNETYQKVTKPIDIYRYECNRGVKKW